MLNKSNSSKNDELIFPMETRSLKHLSKQLCKNVFVFRVKNNDKRCLNKFTKHSGTSFVVDTMLNESKVQDSKSGVKDCESEFNTISQNDDKCGIIFK